MKEDKEIHKAYQFSIPPMHPWEKISLFYIDLHDETCNIWRDCHKESQFSLFSLFLIITSKIYDAILHSCHAYNLIIIATLHCIEKVLIKIHYHKSRWPSKVFQAMCPPTQIKFVYLHNFLHNLLLKAFSSKDLQEKYFLLYINKVFCSTLFLVVFDDCQILWCV